MPGDYSTQHDYLDKLQEDVTARQLNIEEALRKAFASFIERREVEVVVFAGMTVFDLRDAIQSQPVILKSLLACCNVASRALARDLGISVDTYLPKLTDSSAAAIAGYIKPFLPPYLELPAISFTDRLAYIDKEIRRGKGNWERLTLDAANKHAKPRTFRKMKFRVEGDDFELDAAHINQEGQIEIGIDVKRIESPRDIHKRSDDIINKAAKLKSVFPQARFGAVIYYPFIQEHSNVISRLRSPNIDGIVFAGESEDSVERNVMLLLPMLGIDLR